MSEPFLSESSVVSAGQPPAPGCTVRSNIIGAPPVSATRKRGKCVSRRKGQNPEVRVGERAKGKKYYFFQYWIDVPGQEERRRQTEVIGLVSQMTRSEAERKKLDFISRLQLNSNDYRIPSSHNFADAVKHYWDVFAPRMLRDSTKHWVYRKGVCMSFDGDATGDGNLPESTLPSSATNGT